MHAAARVPPLLRGDGAGAQVRLQEVDDQIEAQEEEEGSGGGGGGGASASPASWFAS